MNSVLVAQPDEGVQDGKRDTSDLVMGVVVASGEYKSGLDLFSAFPYALFTTTEHE